MPALRLPGILTPGWPALAGARPPGLSLLLVSLVPVAPAIANAIYDAIGVRLTRLPMNPERVLAAIRSK